MPFILMVILMHSLYHVVVTVTSIRSTFSKRRKLWGRYIRWYFLCYNLLLLLATRNTQNCTGWFNLIPRESIQHSFAFMDHDQLAILPIAACHIRCMQALIAVKENRCCTAFLEGTCTVLHSVFSKHKLISHSIAYVFSLFVSIRSHVRRRSRRWRQR